MDLQANEISNIDVVGELNGEPVKLLRTTGGFHIAVGKRNRSDKSVETLAAGSHPAIVMHQIEKKHGNFQKNIDKSEFQDLSKTEDFSNTLPHYLRAKGFELFAISKNQETEFVTTQKNIEVAKVTIENGQVTKQSLKIDNADVQESIVQAMKQYFL